MKTHIGTYCRECIFLAISVYSELFPPFLGTLTLLSFLPAFLYGCDVPKASPTIKAEAVTRISMASASGRIEDLDIFVFRDDRLQKLDCYQKVDAPSAWNNELISSSGDRIIVVCANTGRTMEDWFSISSLSWLERLTMSLEDEDLRHPFLSGTATVSAEDEEEDTDILLRPLFSIVELRSIRCDFSERPYAGESLEDVKVYLTNVNAECAILDSAGILPSRIINAGGLREEDMQIFPDPSVIYREIDGSIKASPAYPDIQLACYPNNSISEGPGTPFTRLVIEAKVQGETFYWPLDINRTGGGQGIGRNERYIFDLTVTRKGTKDPDIPVRTEDIDIKFSIEKWDEKEDCSIMF